MARSFGLLSTTRSGTHYAIKQAQKALERFGYFLAVVRDTGDMISAKLYGQTTNRDFSKSVPDLTKETGYPINFQFSVSDNKGLTVYSHRLTAGNIAIVTSHETKAIEDAIYNELESQINAGIEFWKKIEARQ